MKMQISFLTFVLALGAATATTLTSNIKTRVERDAGFTLSCQQKPVEIPKDWISMVDSCRSEMRRQIQMEVDASLQYLAMGAYFARDVVNRPGFAKLFFEAGTEERDHATKLLEYLLMRGELTSDVSNLIQVKAPERSIWVNGVGALEDALTMETKVTESIRKVIKACEDDKEFNDYHLVDYLTGEFLEEQYKGQRDLAGKTSTLKKMMNKHEALGEFLFDKKNYSEWQSKPGKLNKYTV